MVSLFRDLNLANNLGGERDWRCGEKGISCRADCWGENEESFVGETFPGICQMAVVEVPDVVEEILLGTDVAGHLVMTDELPFLPMCRAQCRFF